MQTSDIVICTLNSQYIHSSLAPWCLLAGLKAYGEPTAVSMVIEGTINEKVEEVAARIVAVKPQIIGFSCYIWNITAMYQLIELVKQNLPQSFIVLGGPEVSYNIIQVMTKHALVDYCIAGEGERPFALLCNAVLHGESPAGIEGVSYRQGEQIVLSEPYIASEDPPSPYTAEYLEALQGRIAYLETSRGCPYSCAFCLSGRCGNARFFDIERAKQELLLLANSGTQTVKLVDRTFNANRKRAVELFRFIIEHYGTVIPNGVCFHFEIAGDILDDETISLLATAPVGAVQLEIGLQSFNPQTLKAIHRKTNVERLKSNIRRIVENGNMHIHIDLIAGLPYEDMESFAQSFDTAYSLQPHMLQMGFLKLLHGAPMREQPENFPCSFSQTPPYQVTQTPWLNSQELEILHAAEQALDRIYNSGRFRRTLAYLLQTLDITPFELFSEFGVFMREQTVMRLSLDEYTASIFTYFCQKTGVDRMILRDIMVCDRLATNASGLLPPVLRIDNANLKKIKRRLNESDDTRQQKGIKRGLEWLYSENCAVYVDYKEKNSVTGEYKLIRWHEETR